MNKKLVVFIEPFVLSSPGHIADPTSTFGKISFRYCHGNGDLGQ